MQKFSERESWLAAAAVLLQHEVFPAAGIEPASWEQRKYRVSCGFPIGYRGSRTGKIALGQAFDPSISADGTMEVFINPILDKPVDVIAVLAHELTHVEAGIVCGHRGRFASVARGIGLVGPMTSTVPGDDLLGKLHRIATELGMYPHAKIDPNARKKQGTRLLKLQCNSCGWTARVSGLQARRLHDASACPVCSSINSLIVEA
jgi:predicted Zn-ribbon and HTH transcriptional regulator